MPSRPASATTIAASPVEDRLVPYRPFRNWSGSQTCVPAYTTVAGSENDAVETVRYAIRNGFSVRPIGSGLSFSPVCQTGGIMLDTSGLDGITGVDSARQRARVRAGTKVFELAERLWDAGWSLPQQGALDAQGIAGALTTGTHGSSTQLGCMASSIRWLRLVDGTGEVREIGEDDPDQLHAAQVSLGTLGVITELEIDVVPRFYLAEDAGYASWDEAMSQWSQAGAHRYFAMMWFPQHDSADLYSIPMPDGQAVADHVLIQRWNPIELAGDHEIVETFGSRRHRAYAIMSLGGGTMPLLYEELEYMVGAERGQEAITAIRSLLRERHPAHPYPVYARFVAGDPAFLSPFYERDSIALSIGHATERDHWTLFSDVDRLLVTEFDARPHWGKNHLMTRERMRHAYPRYDDFTRIRRELDPDGIFLNDHLRALVG